MSIKGYVAGEDGKAGMRDGWCQSRANSRERAAAGVASGIGHAFQQSSTTLSVSPLGATGTVDPGKQFEADLGTGVGARSIASPSTTSASRKKCSR
jgi:conjugal transfer pilus assembly protein TraB